MLCSCSCLQHRCLPLLLHVLVRCICFLLRGVQRGKAPLLAPRPRLVPLQCEGDCTYSPRQT